MQTGQNIEPARITLEPSQVQIGQPFVCTLSVRHDRADALPVEIPKPYEGSEDWVLLEDASLRTQEVDGAGVETQVRWTFMALQPGHHEVDYTLTLKRGAALEVDAPVLEVLGELGEADEVPRPMAAELPAPDPDRPVFGVVEAGSVLLLVVLGVVAWLFLRKKKSTGEATVEAGPLGLLAQAEWSETGGRDLLFQWQRDLRAALDQRLDKDDAPLTLAVWQAKTEAELLARGNVVTQDDWKLWEQTLGQLEHLKYAQDLPSRLTGEDLQAGVRKLAAGLGGAAPSRSEPQGVSA